MNVDICYEGKIIRSQVLCRIDGFKTFTELMGNHLRCSSFFTQVAGIQPAKNIPLQVPSCEFLWTFLEQIYFGLVFLQRPKAIIPWNMHVTIF